jgi:UTP--glucose-1-phosphate uridylyltransferase
MSERGLAEAVQKMRDEGVGDAAVDTFRHYYERLEQGETGMLPEDVIEPLDDVPDLAGLPGVDDEGREALDAAIVLKLNGGLGTSMGMTQAKSLIEAKDGHSFLDITVRQVLGVRERSGARLPLVLMDSFATQEDTLQALGRHPELDAGLPLDFVQNKVPKLLADDDLRPASWPQDPSKEWAPPGHGDLYTALVTSGLLDRLDEDGFRFAFVSNSDNLGAIFEPAILAWMAREGAPFVMEVTDRTEADRKGGHPARMRDSGRLVLRETAQTPEEDLEALQDIGRHRFVNTNNLWIDLRALRAALDERHGVLGLEMIVNRKTVDPSDKSSPAVIQLETAMGAAVGVFDGARALRVPRTRFAPVKTTNDLLVLRSDAYVLQDDGRVEPAAGRGEEPPVVDLDDDFFKLLRDFEARFPSGPPSLRACDRLTVHGDVTFGAGVTVRGDVDVSGPARIEDGAVLEG